MDAESRLPLTVTGYVVILYVQPYVCLFRNIFNTVYAYREKAGVQILDASGTDAS